MRKTSSLSNFVLWCLSPRGMHSGILAKWWFSPFGMWRRSFSCMSRMFSACVPKNKWSGLMHFGLSHLCKTFIPSGISDRNAIQETRCAHRDLPLWEILVYPFLSMLVVRFQQPASSTATLVIKRVFMSGYFLGIGLNYRPPSHEFKIPQVPA